MIIGRFRCLPPTRLPLLIFLLRHVAVSMSKPARILFYQAYDQAAKKWRSQIHQLCMDYLAALARYRKQPDIQMGCLEVME